MTIQKTTLLLNTPTAGWSESYYRLIGTSENLLQISNDLAFQRMKLLGDIVACVAFRVSQLETAASTALVPTPLKGFLPGVADTPWQSLLINASQGGQKRRSLILRGLPDTVIVNGAYTPNFAWNQALSQFYDELKRRSWGTLTQANSGRINVASVDAGGLATFATDPLLGDQQKVRFFRSVDNDGVLLTGTYTILLTGIGTTRRLKEWKAGRTAAQTALTPLTPLVAAWTDLTALRVTKRNVGRPFGLQRGRRKARPRR